MAKLSFRYGAMNAGKSTHLLQVAHNFEENNKKIILIKPIIDTKGEDKIVSRIGAERKVDILLKTEESLIDNYDKLIKKADAILVDEVQFLKKNQITELWIITKEYDIPVLCFGLKTDFQTNLFEASKRLFELGDEFIELATICPCGKKARFNARLVNGKYTNMGNVIEIDGSNNNIEYKPLCGKCYYEKIVKNNKFNV